MPDETTQEQDDGSNSTSSTDIPNASSLLAPPPRIPYSLTCGVLFAATLAAFPFTMALRTNWLPAVLCRSDPREQKPPPDKLMGETETEVEGKHVCEDK